MSAQVYVINAIKKGSTWSDSYSEYQNYGLSLKGVGEPVKLSLPFPIVEDPEVGDRLYGRLTEEKADNGRIYYKLKLEKRPETDIRSADIHAQVALKLAVEVFLAGEQSVEAYNNIERQAIELGHMINNIREKLL